MANFEALVEGRDIQIGRSTDEPAPRLIEQLMPLTKLGPLVMPLLRKTPDRGTTDPEGFVHFAAQEKDSETEAFQWWTDLVASLAAAIRRDLT
jgi:hypothetical protein